MKFTPGPWFYTPEEGRLPDVYSMQKEGRWNVASINSLRDEYEANARLIAAAPEMHEALRDCVEHMEWSTTHGQSAFKRARAILAKVDE